MTIWSLQSQTFLLMPVGNESKNGLRFFVIFVFVLRLQRIRNICVFNMWVEIQDTVRYLDWELGLSKLMLFRVIWNKPKWWVAHVGFDYFYSFLLLYLFIWRWIGICRKASRSNKSLSSLLLSLLLLLSFIICIKK